MTKRKSSGGGSTLYGVLAGLLIGLMVAAAVAYYVIKAPMPFVDKASRSPEAQGVIDPRTAPDPNAGLYGRDGAEGIAPTGPTDAPLVPLPGITTTPAKPAAPTTTDDLGALIATLPVPSSSASPARPPKAATPALAAPGTGSTATGAAAGGSGSSAVASAAPGAASGSGTTAGAGGTYFLQVGSFRVLEDAESLRARILLMGMPVEIQRAEVNGMQVNRVRVGPYARLDDMNRSRARLGEEKIPATVIRQ